MTETTAPRLMDRDEARGLEDHINAVYSYNAKVILDGTFEVFAYGGRPASVYQNGTLCVSVKAKKAGAVRQLFFKVGAHRPEVTTVAGFYVSRKRSS